MRRAARIDDNQPEIVGEFRRLGWAVAHTHQVGKGFPDLVVAREDRIELIEIKDGNKPPSRQRLTPDEQRFHEEWPAPIAIVTCIEDVRVRFA